MLPFASEIVTPAKLVPLVMKKCCELLQAPPETIIGEVM